ncbi:MAG: PKD domain-containing protein [Opitutales bacterium]
MLANEENRFLRSLIVKMPRTLLDSLSETFPAKFPALLIFLFCGLNALCAESLVYYLVDRSRSMDGSQERPSLVEPVLRSVERHAASLNEDTDVYLQFFWGDAGSLMRWEEFTDAKRAEFLEAVRGGLDPNGNTRLFDTVAEAVDRLRSVASQYEQITLIIFSDGDDNRSSDRSRELRWSLITPKLLKLAEANEFSRTYLIALPGQDPTQEDFREFQKSGIIHTEVPPEQEVIIPVAAPELSFTAFPTKAEPGQTIRFTAKNTGGPVTGYFWNFGDGRSLEGGPMVDHKYSKEGIYDVQLRGVGEGGEDIVEQAACIHIAFSVPLEAAISMFPEEPVSGQAIRFTSESTGKPESLEWLLNGTRVSTGPSYTWDRPSAGGHKIELRIVKGGRTKNAMKAFEVAPPPPSAEFDFPDGDEYEYGAMIRAVALVSGPGVKHSWTIGGSETRSGQSIQWKADREGLIEFVHRVENGRGDISVEADKVLVDKPPEILPDAGFSVEPLPAEVNATLKFTADSVAPDLSHDWYIGGKRIGEGSVIRYVPEKEGTLGIRHVIRKGEVTKENSSEIYVQAPELAVAKFQASDDSGTYPLEVEFADQSEGKIVAYHWDFGDGATSKEANPVHTFDKAGDYTVTLTVTNAAGVETPSPEPLVVEVKEPLPVWVRWAVIGAMAALILLILIKKFSPDKPYGRIRWNYGEESKMVDLAELNVAKVNLEQLGIPGWTPTIPHTIENKGGVKLYRNGAVGEELDRRKEFEVDGATFKYMP